MSTKTSKTNDFKQWLCSEEKSTATIEKYSDDIDKFRAWMHERGWNDETEDEQVIKNAVIQYKSVLKARGLKAASVNVTLAALNSYMKYLGCNSGVNYLKVQQKVFTDEERELTLSEYKMLVKTARLCSNERLALVMETMASTGMRVSELQFLTVESLRTAKVVVEMKSKIRTILLPERLCYKLNNYVIRYGIEEGQIFLTSSGMPLSRKQIWKEMKHISDIAGVPTSKVFPHNLRHVFARTYYEEWKDVVHLADILGHSSINTTRIYLNYSGSECERQLNKLKIIS